MITDWLKQHGDPEVTKLVQRNLAIANKVQRILEERNMTHSDFAQLLGKSPSEISKWLSGTHNLTQKSIIKMELALDVELIHVEKVIKYVYLGKVEGGLQHGAEPYDNSKYNKTMPAYAS